VVALAGPALSFVAVAANPYMDIELFDLVPKITCKTVDHCKFVIAANGAPRGDQVAHGDVVGHHHGRAVVQGAQCVKDCRFVLCVPLQHIVDGEAGFGGGADGAIILHIGRNRDASEVVESRIKLQIGPERCADDAHTGNLGYPPVQHTDIQPFGMHGSKLVFLILQQLGPDRAIGFMVGIVEGELSEPDQFATIINLVLLWSFTIRLLSISGAAF